MIKDLVRDLTQDLVRDIFGSSNPWGTLVEDLGLQVSMVDGQTGQFTGISGSGGTPTTGDPVGTIVSPHAFGGQSFDAFMAEKGELFDIDDVTLPNANWEKDGDIIKKVATDPYDATFYTATSAGLVRLEVTITNFGPTATPVVSQDEVTLFNFTGNGTYTYFTNVEVDSYLQLTGNVATFDAEISVKEFTAPILQATGTGLRPILQADGSWLFDETDDKLICSNLDTSGMTSVSVMWIDTDDNIVVTDSVDLSGSSDITIGLSGVVTGPDIKRLFIMDTSPNEAQQAQIESLTL